MSSVPSSVLCQILPDMPDIGDIIFTNDELNQETEKLIIQYDESKESIIDEEKNKHGEIE